MELHHLRYFAAVAEQLSFRKAADLLRVAQPAVSRAVQQLEAELGAALLERSRSHVKVTPAGVVVLERARKVLDDVGRLAEGLTTEKNINLRVGHVLPEYFKVGALATRLRTFRSENPAIDVETVPMLPRKILADLVKGQIDLGLVWLPLDDIPAEVCADIVLSDEPVVAVSAKHPLASKSTVRLRELSKEKAIVFPRASMPERFDEMASMLRRAGVDQIVTGPPNLMKVLAEVAAGAGFAIVPRLAASVHERLGFALCSLDGVAAPWSLAVLRLRTPKQQVINRVAKALIS